MFFAETNLQKTVADNIGDIIKSLTANDLVNEIISVLTERHILQQHVDILCKRFYKTEQTKITNIKKCVLKGDMKSMLNFAYALFIVGEVQYVAKLLQTEV